MKKSLEDFRNIHKDSDIYIIASGKSLDYIDNSFFENKITIGVNQVYNKILTKYLVRKEHILLDKIMNINTIHFVSEGNCGDPDNINDLYIKTNYSENDNIIVYKHDANICEVNELPDDNKLIVSWSTITTAIHLAAFMGAKNILLVAHDCGFLDNESNFTGYHNDDFKPDYNIYNNWLPLIENQTIKLKSLLKEKYNCNIYSLNPFINFNLENHIYKKTID